MRKLTHKGILILTHNQNNVKIITDTYPEIINDYFAKAGISGGIYHDGISKQFNLGGEFYDLSTVISFEFNTESGVVKC